MARANELVSSTDCSVFKTVQLPSNEQIFPNEQFLTLWSCFNSALQACSRQLSRSCCRRARYGVHMGG